MAATIDAACRTAREPATLIGHPLLPALFVRSISRAEARGKCAGQPSVLRRGNRG
jgi:hypothetical protein